MKTELYDSVVREVRNLLESSPKMTKKNNILEKCLEMISERNIEDEFSKILLKYVIYLNVHWIQQSYKNKKNLDFATVTRIELGKIISSLSHDKAMLTHLLNLHHAIWNEQMIQLQDYQVKMKYLKSGCKKFKNKIKKQNDGI